MKGRNTFFLTLTLSVSIFLRFPSLRFPEGKYKQDFGRKTQTETEDQREIYR